MTLSTPSANRRLGRVLSERTLYWVTTALIAALMFGTGLQFMSRLDAFQRFGLPAWFALELTVAKLAGSLVLLLPGAPPWMKDFAYFGFGLTIVSADVAHLSVGDSPWMMVPHATFLAILITSYRLHHKLHPA